MGQGDERRDRPEEGALTCCAETLRSRKCPGAQGQWCSASWGSQRPRARHPTKSMGPHVCWPQAPSPQPQASLVCLPCCLGGSLSHALTLEANDLLIFPTSQVKVLLYTAFARASLA